MASMTEILARWDSDEGRPYKGKLIDKSAYRDNPDNIGCMCAQGQVLHLIAGWDADRLSRTEQVEADAATAKLRNVNDTLDGAPGIVLTDPEKVLGDQWSKLLDFWWHLDQMTKDQWAAAWDAARAAAWDAAWDAARDAARAAARAAARDAARAAARAAARDAANAASEIQGARLLREQGKPFFFLPLLGFADPEAIPARPVDYGKLVEPA
jgi:hypothetical protein